MEKNLTLPIIHPNGTRASELLRQRFDVIRALHTTLDALAQAAPNGRDYYPGGDGLYAAARAQHKRRRATLLALLEEIENESEAIADLT